VEGKIISGLLQLSENSSEEFKNDHENHVWDLHRHTIIKNQAEYIRGL
jgi:hypothetical protein